MDDDENANDGGRETKKKHKKSRHRDEEHRSKTRDDDDDGRRERRREKKSKKAEDGGNREDETEEERRRRKKKELEKAKQRDEDEATRGSGDDPGKHRRVKESKEEPMPVADQRTSGMAENSTGDSSAPRKSKTKSSNKKEGDNDDDDDESNLKILKPSRRVKKEEDVVDPNQEQRPFVNLWELAIKKMEERDRLTKEEREEKSILIVGEKNTGKSTLVLRFLDKTHDIPKPTVALDYNYARKAKENKYETKTAHLWELGGGIQMSKLVESVIDEESIGRMRIALVIDLGAPKVLWASVEKWLEILRKRIEEIIKRMDNGKAMKEKLELKAKQRIKEGHQDLEMMDLFPLPIIMIGTKYDIFQNLESEERKIISRTLRFMSHRIGAHLQFCAHNHEGSISRVRTIIGSFLFDAPLSLSNQVAHNKVITVLAGTDSFQDIGLPPVASGDAGRFAAKSPVDLWKYAYTNHYPQEDITLPPIDQDPTKDPQFKEPDIDSLIAQKEAEFARYLKTMDVKHTPAEFSPAF